LAGPVAEVKVPFLTELIIVVVVVVVLVDFV
jgi:hypothetical protein